MEADTTTETTKDYGLELTNNSKTSWAFSMPRDRTCIMATGVCRRLCYGNGIRYQSKGQKAKRMRNYRTVELLLIKDGPELLAENLVGLLDQVRPSDWLAARITGDPTKTPWTLRIHDVGDFHKKEYVRSWIIAAEKRPDCSLWFYTRSFRERRLFEELTELAALPNCRGFLSVDTENYEAGVKAVAQGGGVWKLAMLQQKEEEIGEMLGELVGRDGSGAGEILSFPYHRGRYHVEPVAHPDIFTCPAVTGEYKLESSASKLRPCQACSYCLP